MDEDIVAYRLMESSYPFTSSFLQEHFNKYTMDGLSVSEKVQKTLQDYEKLLEEKYKMDVEIYLSLLQESSSHVIRSKIKLKDILLRTTIFLYGDNKDINRLKLMGVNTDYIVPLTSKSYEDYKKHGAEPYQIIDYGEYYE